MVAISLLQILKLQHPAISVTLLETGSYNTGNKSTPICGNPQCGWLFRPVIWHWKASCYKSK